MTLAMTPPETEIYSDCNRGLKQGPLGMNEPVSRLQAVGTSMCCNGCDPNDRVARGMPTPVPALPKEGIGTF